MEFTKSRLLRSNDNGLAEIKNSAIVRKHLGYSDFPQRFAHSVNAFGRDFLNPYVNFHRPCFFPASLTDAKGKTRKRYRFGSQAARADSNAVHNPQSKRVIKVKAGCIRHCIPWCSNSTALRRHLHGQE